MNNERTKEMSYKPIIYGVTKANLAFVIGCGIANVAWIAIFKVPNPFLLDALYVGLGC